MRTLWSHLAALLVVIRTFAQPQHPTETFLIALRDVPRVLHTCHFTQRVNPKRDMLIMYRLHHGIQYGMHVHVHFLDVSSIALAPAIGINATTAMPNVISIGITSVASTKCAATATPAASAFTMFPVILPLLISCTAQVIFFAPSRWDACKPALGGVY